MSDVTQTFDERTTFIVIRRPGGHGAIYARVQEYFINAGPVTVRRRITTPDELKEALFRIAKYTGYPFTERMERDMPLYEREYLPENQEEF